jgi:DNA-binding Xre family transcriptional regulator
MARLCIREIAEKRQINQSQLQKSAKVSVPLLNRYWHNYTKSVSLAQLEKIARALGVRPGDLIVSSSDEETA